MCFMDYLTEVIIPVKMLYEELQSLVVSWWQLPQQVLDLKEDPVELHADLCRGHGVGTEPQRLKLLHYDALAFLGQTDEVVVVAEEDERLWKLQRKVCGKNRTRKINETRKPKINREN